jgi:N-acetylmuramoyl-L-alanine amidase
MSYGSVVISSGHGLHVRGASGILDEVDEARKVVECVAEKLRKRGVEVSVFHDDVSTTQNENLNRIVDFHNGRTRELDVSVHFNAYEQVSEPMGTEVLFVTQSELAGEMSAVIAEWSGLIDRGGKKRSDLFFLNNTEEPAILIETCFVDSEADADLYGEFFDGICEGIANVLGGEDQPAERPPVERPPVERPIMGRVDIDVSGNVVVYVNGVRVVD